MVILAFLLFIPSDTEGKTEHRGPILANSVVGYSSPVTVKGDWPEPIITPYYWGNCVATVRNAGYYVPPVPRNSSGQYSPLLLSVDSTDIAEGEVRVAVTYEGPVGHVLVVQKVNGQLISIVEGNHPVGVGRVVPLSVLKGFLNNSY